MQIQNNTKNIIKKETFLDDLIFQERNTYDNQLYALTKFNKFNSMFETKINKIILNFSFKTIGFNRKKVIPFFLIMELLTGQKCCSTKSSKNVLFLKLRQGSVAGCKITLRKKAMYNFIDTLILALPRSDNFIGFSFKKFKKNKTNAISFVLKDLFTFYPAETRLNANIQKLDITILFNTKVMEEKLFLLLSNYIPILNN